MNVNDMLGTADLSNAIDRIILADAMEDAGRHEEALLLRTPLTVGILQGVVRGKWGYSVRMSVAGAEHVEYFEAFNDEDASYEAHHLVRQWVYGGDWGEEDWAVEGAWVLARWTVYDQNGDQTDEDSDEIDIEPDHDDLVEAAGGDAACEHDCEEEDDR